MLQCGNNKVVIFLKKHSITYRIYIYFQQAECLNALEMSLTDHKKWNAAQKGVQFVKNSFRNNMGRDQGV
jgi:hypothetical protein